MSPRQPSRRLEHVSSAIFTEMAERKREASRAREVIDLGIGSPDRPPAAHLIEALAEAVQKPGAYGYPGTQGTLVFRQEVANWYNFRFGVELDAETECTR